MTEDTKDVYSCNRNTFGTYTIIGPGIDFGLSFADKDLAETIMLHLERAYNAGQLSMYMIMKNFIKDMF